MKQRAQCQKNSHGHVIHGLYVIADTSVLSGDGLVDAITSALSGGAQIVQYRDKSKNVDARRMQAIRLLKICRQFNKPFLINDDISLARDTGADGVHIGRDDATIIDARKMLGDNAIIGVSCYNSIELAEVAQSSGADYVAFGSFFRSNTKPDAIPAPLPLLTEASSSLRMPIVAIGGINAENAGALVDAGADAVAVIRDLLTHDNIEHQAEKYTALFH